jgi:hypothetical protein
MSIEDQIKKYEHEIYTTAYIAAASGTWGAFIPVMDTVYVSASWVIMIGSIAEKANRKLEKETVAKFVSGILAGSAAYLAGTKVLVFLLNAIPGLGTLGAVGINALLNFLYTIRLGRYIALAMEKPDFNTSDWANLIPEITSVVFGIPTVPEMQEAFKNWNTQQQYKK